MIETEDFFVHWCGFYFFLPSPFFHSHSSSSVPCFRSYLSDVITFEVPGRGGWWNTVDLEIFFPLFAFPLGSIYWNC